MALSVISPGVSQRVSASHTSAELWLESLGHIRLSSIVASWLGIAVGRSRAQRTAGRHQRRGERALGQGLERRTALAEAHVELFGAHTERKDTK